MKKQLMFVVAILIVTGVFGQKKHYLPESIDPALSRSANAVVRKASTVFVVDEKGNGNMKVEKALTILNQKGDKYATLAIPYDSFRSVRGVKVKVYDKDGSHVRTIKKSELMDYPSMASFSLYEDNRILLYSPRQHMTYPFSIEWTYEIDFEGLLYSPSWIVQEAADISVENSEFQLEFTKLFPIKFQYFNLPKPEFQNDEGVSRFKWKVQNLKSAQKDYDFDPYSQRKPVVYTAPTTINLDGYIAKNSSWTDFGNWFHDLNEGRDDLEPQTVAMVRNLVANAETEEEKVRLIYKHLQQNTRYVNISLGIGGFQSFPAAVVDEVGYGDCKALTTYTKGMLKAAGIHSNYALVNAGMEKKPFRRNFPSSQFNHVILAVPMEKDTIWLECTSQRNPFGFLGTFTDNREVLWIAKDSSSIVGTPRYGMSENTVNREVLVTFREDGSATVEVVVRFTGLQTELNGLKWITNGSEEKQQTWVNRYLNIPEAQVDSFSFKQYDEPVIDLTIRCSTKRLAQNINKDLLINSLFPVENDGRDYLKKEGTFQIDRSYMVTETLLVKVPEGYHPQVTDPFELANSYVNYRQNSEVSKDGIRVSRLMQVFEAEVTEEMKETYFNGWKELVKNSKGSILLKSKT